MLGFHTTGRWRSRNVRVSCGPRSIARGLQRQIRSLTAMHLPRRFCTITSLRYRRRAGRVYVRTLEQSRCHIRPASLREPSNKLMGDPRNVAHAKKVSQEKHHKEKHAPKAGPISSQRAKNVQTETKAATNSTVPKAEPPKPTQPVEPTQLEKSLVVLSKLKELEFHSRANIEKL